jgi:hypothetical protein
MYHLPKPHVDAEQVFDTCVSLYANKKNRSKLNDSKSTIFGEIKVYESYAHKALLFKMEQYDGVENLADGKMLRGLYSRMLDKKRAGRAFYDEIRSSADSGTCPYCGQRKVSTLDHYLPKSIFPIFSVAPINLVPSCVECNKDKMVEVGMNPYEQFIHPYFDRFPSGKWLHAEVLETSPASFRFFVKPPEDWPPVFQKRISYHFKKLNLAALYTSHAGSRLTSIRLSLRRCRARSEDDVKIWLDDSTESARSANPNSWETAFYEACLTSAWFWAGGFED